LADLVKDIKVSSSIWIKERGIYPLYVINQQEHHKRETLREEFIRLLKENGVDFVEKYLV
jgi:hypothetical protein